MSDSCSVTQRSLTLAFDRLVSCGLRRDGAGVCVRVPDCVCTPTSECVHLYGGSWRWECAGEGRCAECHPLGDRDGKESSCIVSALAAHWRAL